jgi:hypothetical protein
MRVTGFVLLDGSPLANFEGVWFCWCLYSVSNKVIQIYCAGLDSATAGNASIEDQKKRTLHGKREERATRKFKTTQSVAHPPGFG